MRPMAQGEANPLLEHFARIPAADCFVLPFEKIANRSFTDDPSGVRGWTGAGLPDFRQGPRGDLKFHAVPYRIPADGRALILRGVKRLKSYSTARRLSGRWFSSTPPGIRRAEKSCTG